MANPQTNRVYSTHGHLKNGYCPNRGTTEREIHHSLQEDPPGRQPRLFRWSVYPGRASGFLFQQLLTAFHHWGGALSGRPLGWKLVHFREIDLSKTVAGKSLPIVLILEHLHLLPNEGLDIDIRSNSGLSLDKKKELICEFRDSVEVCVCAF